MQAHGYINMLFIYSAGDSIFVEGVMMMGVVSCHVTLFLTRKKLVIIGGFLWDHKQCCMAYLTEPRYLAWLSSVLTPDQIVTHIAKDPSPPYI